jgi:hypothetical protein
MDFIEMSPLDFFHSLGGDAIKIGGTTKVSFAYLSTPATDSFSHSIGVISSTNEGATWVQSDTVVVGSLPGLVGYNIETVVHGSNIALDSLGHPHLVGYLTTNTGSHVIAEIYKDTIGWKSKIINILVPAVVPILHPTLSRNKEGTAFVVTYDLNATVIGIPPPIEYHNNGVFLTGRKLSSKNWKSPVAIYPGLWFEVPTAPWVSIAPRLRYDSTDNYKAFLAVEESSKIVPTRSYLKVGSAQVNVASVAVDWTPFAFQIPIQRDTFTIGSPIFPKVSFRDIGEVTGTYSVNCTFKIFNSSGLEIYSAWVPASIHSDSIRTVTYGGFSPPDTGVYRMQAIAKVQGVTDNNPANDTLNGYFTIINHSVSTPVIEGWNLLSLGINPLSPHASVNYPQALGGPFVYKSGYQLVDSIPIGSGFWVKFHGVSNVQVFGKGPLDTISIPVFKGWNMIGSLSTPLPVASITSTPPGITTSQFFGYSGFYIVRTVINPGTACWVKCDTNGTLHLSSGAFVKAVNCIKIIPSNELPPPMPGVEAGSTDELPKDYALEQNYPNPFNPMTSIKYALPFDSKVKLTIYNVLGQVVNVLVNDTEPAGYKEYQWNAMNAASGIYFYKLEATNTIDPSKNFIEVKKMLLVK